MTRIKKLSLVIGLMLVAAGCSSSSDGNGSTTSQPVPSSPAGTTSSSPATATPPSRAELARIVVQPADVPQGWTGSPSDSSGDARADAAMHRCLGGPDTTPHRVAEVDSDDYSMGNATISSTASSYKSQRDIAVDEKLLRSPKIEPCYERLLRGFLGKALPAGARVDTLDVQITPGSGGGPANVVATGAARIKVTVQGQQVGVYVDIAFITGPLVEAQVTFENIGQPVEETLQRQVVAAVAARAAKA